MFVVAQLAKEKTGKDQAKVPGPGSKVSAWYCEALTRAPLDRVHIVETLARAAG